MDLNRDRCTRLRCWVSFYLFYLSFLPFASALTFNNTALVIGTSADGGQDSSWIFDSYGIPYEGIIIPDKGGPLPTLETADVGSYGLFLIAGQAMVNGSSVLTQDQWNTIYAYQEKYGTRMVHVDALAGPNFGVVPIGTGCCAKGVEQWLNLIPDVATRMFPGTGLR